MPAIPTSTTLVDNPEVHSKWHITFEAALGISCIIVFIFALLVLYVVTHMKENVISDLKATIRSQKKELKDLRKLRRKNEEVRRMLLPKGNVGERMGYETVRGLGNNFGKTQSKP